jgi:outer membrane assembly lipoprotein YfiO
MIPYRHGLRLINALRKPTLLWMCFLTLMMLSVGCASRAKRGVDTTRPSDQISIEDLRLQFEEGQYLTVVNDARTFMSRFPGSGYLDEAMYLLARAEYEDGNFIEAEGRFRKVLRDFPNGSYAEESAYYLALALLSQARKPELDQAETEGAQAQFRMFLQRFPNSEHVPQAQEHLEHISNKFAEKSFKNAETYRKLKDWDAAEFYYQKIWSSWPMSEWAPRALVQLSQINLKRRLYRPAVAWARIVLDEFPDTPDSRDAQRLLDQAEKELGELPPRAFEEADSTSAGSPQ